MYRVIYQYHVGDHNGGFPGQVDPSINPRILLEMDNPIALSALPFPNGRKSDTCPLSVENSEISFFS